MPLPRRNLYYLRLEVVKESHMAMLNFSSSRKNNLTMCLKGESEYMGTTCVFYLLPQKAA